MEEFLKTIMMFQGYQASLFALVAFAMYFRQPSFSKQFLGWIMVICSVYSFSLLAGISGSGMPALLSGVPGATLLLLFPTFFFYIKSLIIKQYTLGGEDLHQLIPALVVLFLPMVCILLDGSGNNFGIQADIITGNGKNTLTRLYILLVYGGFTLQIMIYSNRVARLLKIHKDSIEKEFSDISQVRLAWINFVLVVMLLFLALVGISWITGLRHSYLVQVICGLMEWIITVLFGLFGLLQKDIRPHLTEEPEMPLHTTGSMPVNGNDDNLLFQTNGGKQMIPPAPAGQESIELAIMRKVAEMQQEINPDRLIKTVSQKKYAGSGLTELQKSILARRLDRLMKEKYYLNEKLCIDELADKLETNSKYLSQVINETYGQNFYTFINTYRVEEASRLLGDRQHQKYSIQGIARMVGFSSKSCFNEAFRHIMGMTPSQYLKKK